MTADGLFTPSVGTFALGCTGESSHAASAAAAASERIARAPEARFGEGRDVTTVTGRAEEFLCMLVSPLVCWKTQGPSVRRATTVRRVVGMIEAPIKRHSKRNENGREEPVSRCRIATSDGTSG